MHTVCRLALAAFSVLGGASSDRCMAADADALNAIFGDENLAGNGIEVCARARDLPVEERFAFLCDSVLPSADRPSFRVVADFSPTFPPHPSSDGAEEGFRVPVGGEIVSPVFDLIEAASSLGRLEELQEVISSTPAQSIEDEIDQQALLALVDVARGDTLSAKARLSELFALVVPEGDSAPRRSDPLLLCVHRAADHPELSRAIVDAAHRVVLSYQQEYERTVWQRQYTAAFARLQQAAESAAAEATVERTRISLARWTAASPPRARYRGTGCPIARWDAMAGRVENVSSHDQDFLYFASPLRGNYEVECDVTSFGWRDSSLLAAGRWTGPVYDHRSYDQAGVDGYVARIKFEPRLSRVGDHIRYRVVVRDGMATTFFNGRAIDRRPLSTDHDPWLAVRSAARHDGGVSDLSITGEPTVPESIRLFSSADLTAWVPYYDEIVGIDWRYRDAGEELYTHRQLQLPRGSHCESALFYHRPMLEDGDIEYAFWYEAGRCEAHPVLGRLCFLLHPDGVNLHWLTDGSYDRTGLPPDNVTVERENRRGVGPLPLRASDWNGLKLSVRGNRVDLVLNGELVYQREIEATNQRHFGLFHYADQTDLRVREIVWRGEWPRRVPRLGEQELISRETEFLDERRAELGSVFEHDFSAEGLPPRRFSVLRGNRGTEVIPGSDGLCLTKEAAGGYRDSTVVPNLTVSGDFDIAASFDQLETDPHGTGSSTVFIQMIFDNDAADECLFIRRHTFARGGDHHFIQCARVTRPDGQARRRYFGSLVVEARAGTFRVARRGDQVYYLFAENDSRQFRLIAQDSCPTDDIRMNGIRLDAQIHGIAGSTSVLWKELRIQAESLSGPAVRLDERRLQELNARRDSLSQSLLLDFAESAPESEMIRRWGVVPEWNRDDEGLLIVAPGSDAWTSAGAALQRGIEGDFDISILFDPQRIDVPAEGQNSSVYLQIELDDTGDTQLSLIFQRLEDGSSGLLAQVSVENEKSTRDYRRLGRLDATTVTGLRVARRGRQVICVALSDELETETIFAEGNVGDAPLNPNCTRVMVHTGGAGRESRVVWKSIEVRADRILE